MTVRYGPSRSVAVHGLRGRRISIIFHGPQTSLNPLMRIEDQMISTILAHEGISVVFPGVRTSFW